MFYFTIREDLKEYSPFYKFLAVKLVIFFSFWQSVLIEGLVYFGNQKKKHIFAKRTKVKAVFS